MWVTEGVNRKTLGIRFNNKHGASIFFCNNNRISEILYRV